MAFPKSQSIIIVFGIGWIMQNHAKKWFNYSSSTNAMAAIAIGAMLVFSVVGMKAFADNVQDDIESSAASRTITEGQSTTVQYWIVSNGQDGLAGCDAADGSSAKITFNVPDGVSVDPASRTFSTCKVGSDNNAQSATYTSDTPGSYSISVSVSDSRGSYNTNPAEFTLIVEAADDGSGGSGGGGGTTDTTPPVITADVQGTKGDNDWYTSDVTVHWTITDDESTVTSTSGCDDVTISEDTNSDGRTITCEATSAGGTSRESVTIKRDATDPTVSLVNGPADGSSHFWGFLPDKPTCEAEDPTPGSGLAGDCTVGDYDQTVGSHTVTATAKDNAGNTAEDSNAYTVKEWEHSGFYQPVDKPNTVNTVKGGSTVPFKFELFADSEFTSTTFNGNPIGAFSATKTSCSGGTTDDIELTATGGTSFRYDSTGGQFIYNWKTPTGANQCYSVTFTDQSGGTLSALFRTK